MLAFLEIPLSILKAILAVPGELWQLKIDYSSKEESWAKAQTSELEAAAKLLEAKNETSGTFIVGNYSSSQTVEDALVQQIGRFRAVGSRQIGFFADTRFYLPSTREVEVLLRDIPLQPTGFLGEVFDCDDYSFVMKAATSIYARDTLRINAGLCFGIAWGRVRRRINSVAFV